MRAIVDAFTAHPAEVGETYRAHLVAASGFGVALIGAGLACLVHAVLPFAFKHTGSRAIARLHQRMVTARRG